MFSKRAIVVFVTAVLFWTARADARRAVLLAAALTGLAVARFRRRATVAA
jgi:hypothetical protein